MRRPIQIVQSKLMLVEGADAYYFAMHACSAIRPGEIQVVDFGGVSDLTQSLRVLVQLPNYENVTTIVVVRDAEQNPAAAFQSVRSSLITVGLPLPERPFEFSAGSPRVALMLFPGGVIAENHVQCIKGTLEDLCLKLVEGAATISCVDRFLRCVRAVGQSVQRAHKFRLHAFLATQNEYVGMKIGEAAKAGAWDWNHSRFGPFRRVIEEM
jgi:hypothetical protein